MVDRNTRLRLLRQRLEIAMEDGHEHEFQRVIQLIAEVEHQIEAQRQRLTWGDEDISIKRNG